jgi:hypothetical protein
MSAMGIPKEATTENRDPQPGEMVSGKGILIGEFDLVDVSGKSLGIRTRWYDAAIDLGRPKIFNNTAAAVAKNDTNGRGGLKLNPARYEAELFETLKSGEALGKNVIAPLEVVKAIYQLRNSGEYKHMSDANRPGKLITMPSGTFFAPFQWSCTPHRSYPNLVRVVDFSDGFDVWLYRDSGRLSGRTCFAELAL